MSVSFPGLVPCAAGVFRAVLSCHRSGFFVFDQVEKLKQDFTDKYVVVDDSVPELARFAGHVGQVKTVNMNGRALVQFDAWSNVGWYDIELDYLKVVPKPEVAAEAQKHDTKGEAPRPATKAAPAAQPGEKKLSPLEMARMQGAAKGASAKPAPAGAAEKSAAPPGGAKRSTADILAAARGGKVAPTAGTEKAAETTAKARPSTADILAAARAKKSAEPPAGEAPAASEATQPAPPTATEAPPPAAPAPAKAQPAAAKPALAPGQRPSVSEILAWCRQHDAK
jgi:hypothetical protein